MRRYAQANGTCCCKWECSHWTQATSKPKLAEILHARVWCGLGLRVNFQPFDTRGRILRSKMAADSDQQTRGGALLQVVNQKE